MLFATTSKEDFFCLPSVEKATEIPLRAQCYQEREDVMSIFQPEDYTGLLRQ